MAVVNELINAIRYETDRSSEQKAQQALDDMASRAERLRAMIARAGGALFNYTRQFAELADEAVKTARNLGMNVEELTELEYAGQRSGAQVNRLRDGIKDLQKNSIEAARGAKEMAKDFRRLGINARRFSSLPVGEKLEMIANGLKTVENPAERAQIRMRLLGESGLFLGNLLDGGAESIRRYREEARKLGVVIDEEVAKQAEQMNDALLNTRSAVESLARPFAIALLPVITESAREITEFIQSLEPNVIRESAREVATSLRNAFRVIFEVTTYVRENMQLIKAALIGITGAAILGNLAQMGRAMATIAKFAGISSIQFLLAAAAVAALYLVVDDLVAFIKGEDSVIATLIGDPQEIEHTRNALLMMMQDFDNALANSDSFLAWLSGQLDLAYDYWIEVFSNMFQDVADMFVSWQKRMTLDEWVENLKSDLKEFGLNFDKSINLARAAFEGLGAAMLIVIERISIALGEFVKSLSKVAIHIDKALGVNTSDIIGALPSPDSYGSIGTVSQYLMGSTSTGLDISARQAQQMTTRGPREVRVERIDVTLPEGTNLTQKQLTDAVSGGVADGITAADLRRAGRSTDGAMQ